MFKISVEKKATEGTLPDATPVFEIRQENDQWFIGADAFDGDIAEIKNNHFHVLWKNKSYNVEMIAYNPTEKTYQLKINGQLLETSVKDQFDQLLEGLGMQTAVSKKINNLKAPMPGLIQSVSIEAGQAVQKGDILLVLVAMKMENMIKSTGEGIVKTVKVKPGEIVEKNQVLIEFQ